jgi:hypothetical protein
VDIQLGFMVELKREKALSELIGFILLLGLLVMVASLYLTYVVPAQGREGEIAHMEYIKGQFLDYKIGTDALWVNNAQGVSISQAITLGTQGVKTTGMFAGFQIFSPVFSGGMLSVNPDPNPTLSISVLNPLFNDNVREASSFGPFEPVNRFSGEITDPLPLSFDSIPSKLRLTITPQQVTSSTAPEEIDYNDLISQNYFYGAEFTSVDGQISVSYNAVRRYITKDYSWSYLGVRSFDNLPTGSSTDNLYYVRYETDVILNVVINDVNILENYVVKSNIGNGEACTIDLMDPVYGIRDKLNAPFDCNIRKIIGTNNVFNLNIDYEEGPISSSSIAADEEIFILPQSDNYISKDSLTRPFGRLEYNSNNKYYRTQQNFIYQMGGVFVTQMDGTSPLNLPLISITDNNPKLSVDITAIRLFGDESIAGSSPVQITSNLRTVSDSVLDSSQENVAEATIKIEIPYDQSKLEEVQDAQSLSELWHLVFNSIKRSSGISSDSAVVEIETDYSSNPKTVTMVINGYNPDDDTTAHDIKLSVRYVDFDVELDAVGKTIGI